MQGVGGLLNVGTFPPGAGLGQRIVIDGERGAIFQYNASNQLVTSWASEAGTDPYGNVYPAGLDISGSGLVIEGDYYLINQVGAFFYTAAPAAGDLLASIASNSGTDAEGNTYTEGVTAYVVISNGDWPGTYAVNLADQALPGGEDFASLSFRNLTNVAYEPPTVAAAAHDTGGTVLMLQSGLSTSGVGGGAQIGLLDANAVINFDFALQSGVPVIVLTSSSGTGLVYSELPVTFLGLGTAPDQQSPGAILWSSNTNGGWLHTSSGSTGDSNVWNIGQIILSTSSLQTISSESQTAITGLSLDVTAGITYYFRANVVVKGLSANDMYITMGGTASSSGFRASITYLGPGQNVVQQQTTLGTNTGLNSNALVNGDYYDVVVEGYAVISGSGTLVVNAAASANASSYDVLGGSTMFLAPLVG